MICSGKGKCGHDVGYVIKKELWYCPTCDKYVDIKYVYVGKWCKKYDEDCLDTGLGGCCSGCGHDPIFNGVKLTEVNLSEVRK